MKLGTAARWVHAARIGITLLVARIKIRNQYLDDEGVTGIQFLVNDQDLVNVIRMSGFP
jgi:hypothetical protein